MRQLKDCMLKLDPSLYSFLFICSVQKTKTNVIIIKLKLSFISIVINLYWTYSIPLVSRATVWKALRRCPEVCQSSICYTQGAFPIDAIYVLNWYHWSYICFFYKLETRKVPFWSNQKHIQNAFRKWKKTIVLLNWFI